MKKFDTLISNYLYTNRQVDLEGIGSFSLDEHFVLPPDADKTAFYPLEGIQFEHNSRAETTPALLDFLMQQTGKIKSLIRADFSSYLAEIKQFVNIGKPWVIEGIGTLQKNRQGKFEFVPGAALSERINVHYAEEPETREEPVKRNRWIIGLLFSLAIAAVVAGLGFGIYVLFIKTQDNNTSDQVAVTPQSDTSNAKTDTVSRKPDSIGTVAAAGTDTTNNYRAIFEITKWKERVDKRTAQLAQYGIKAMYDSMVIRDTLRYRMFIYQKIPLQDSARVRDSLSLYFGRRVRLEKIR